MNQLIIYCKKLDQAALWDICRSGKCSSDGCLYQRVLKTMGTDEIGSSKPLRFDSFDDIKENFELLKDEFNPETMTLIIPANPMKLCKDKIIAHEQPREIPGKIIRTPVKLPSSFNDVLKQIIIEKIQ